MPTYKAPLREYRFLLKDVLDIERYSNLPSFSEAPIDLIDQVLEEGAKFCEGVLAPLNKVGDEHGCKRHPDGSVETPPGFKEAYRQYVEAGWPALSGDPAYIPRHRDARNKIRKLERDEIIEELMKSYLKEHLG